MKKQIFITVLLVQILLLNTSQIAAQNNFTPEWSKGIVWYQIFPERFNNGDPDNDPKVIDQNGRILLTTHQLSKFIHGPAIGINCNLTNRKMGKAFTTIYSGEGMEVICRG